MAASLKLVADSSWFQQQAAEIATLPKPRDLQIFAIHAAETKGSAPSYRMLGLVFAMHAALLASALMAKSDAAVSKPVSTPITVSLLNAPSAEKPQPLQPKLQPSVQPNVEPKAKPEPQLKPVEAKQNKPAPAPQSKQPVELPVKETIISRPAMTALAEQHKSAESHTAENITKSEHEAPAAEAPARADTVVEEVIEPPRFGAAYLNNPPPVYPSMSRRAGEQGRVLLKVLVSESGHAETVQIDTSSGFDKLDRAAVEAVKKWSFVPAKLSNQPVSAFVLVPIKFALNT